MSPKSFAIGASIALGLFSLTLAQSSTPQDYKKPADLPPPNADPGGTCPQGATTLCIPLDASFTPVDMNQLGGSGPASAADFCQRNDDDSGVYSLTGWTFSHFGTAYSDVYINNNGNISFGASFSTFTPSGFPVSGFPMVAPFWGDVDTGDIADAFGGVAWMREESIANGDAVNRLTVTWDHVGYYNENSDLLNTFQVIISDGNDPLLGIGNNVCFCYDNMSWTTGDASQGSGGFGGAPATVGANQGNGVDFFQIGTFDHPGNDYDGPAGAVDGVDFLDGATFCFNISGVEPNVPPIWINPPSACLEVGVGHQLVFAVQATGPEIGEIVTITENHGGLTNFSCVPVAGNPGTATCTFDADISHVGNHTISFLATDDGTPSLSTPLSVCIEVTDPLGSPTCFGDGTGTPCPCNDGAAGEGCENTTGSGALLAASGTALFASDTFACSISGMPAGKPGILIAGTTAVNGGLGNVVGDGIFCTSPHIRSQVTFASGAGTASITDWRGQPFGSFPSAANLGVPTYYQYWYRDPDSTCTGGGFNFSNAWVVTWQ